MKKLIIPLLAATALLGGCQHVTVRHSVHVPVPVEVVEHRHVHGGVVVLHRHEGGHHSSHRHENHPTTRRVVVVTPAPVIRHKKVTVHHVERDQQHGRHLKPQRQHWNSHTVHPAPDTPHAGREHRSPRDAEAESHPSHRSQGVTPPPHAARHQVKPLPSGRASSRTTVTRTKNRGTHQVVQRTKPKPVPETKNKARRKPENGEGEEHSASRDDDEHDKQQGKSGSREKEENHKGH